MLKSVFIVLAIFVASAIQAQDLHIYPVALVDPKDFGGSVNCIFQDKTGFIWIGKETGLYRYDGYQIKGYLYNANDPSSISNNNILAISEDANGGLWVGTKGGGLNKFDASTGKFTRYLHDDRDPGSLSFNEVYTIVPAGTGHLWVGTDGGGLNLFDIASGRFQKCPADGNETTGFQSNKILRMQPASPGKYWVGTWSGGFHLYDTVNKKVQHLGDGTDYAKCKVFAIREVRQGLLWICTWDQGLIAYDVRSNKFSVVVDPSVIAHFRDIQVAKDGAIWVTSTVGLLHFSSPTSGYKQVVDDALPGFRDIMSVFVDKAQMVWVGYKSGVVGKVNPIRKKFFTIPPEQPFSNSSIASVSADKNGKEVYYSTWKYLARYNPATNEYKQWAAPYNEFVALVDIPGTDSLLCAASGGLVVFDKSTGLFSNMVFDQNSPSDLWRREILTVVGLSDSTFWVGASGVAYQLAFSAINNCWKVAKIYYADAGGSLPPSHFTTSFLQEQKGGFWIGTFGGGLNRLGSKDEHFTTFMHDIANPKSIADNFVECLLGDGQDYIWAGTHAGLNRFNIGQKTFQNITVANGLASDWINAMAIDARKRIWLGTKKGISSISDDATTIHNYDMDDGLPSNTFISRSVSTDPKGNLYFGSAAGLVWFHPDSIGSNAFLPEPVLVDFKVNENSLPIGNGSPLQKAIELTDLIQLENDQSSFSFQMAALSYFNPSKNKVKYKLDGYDKDWRIAGADQLAIYSLVPWGTYKFSFMVGNEDGVWNPKVKTITIVVARPAWLSNSALYSLVVLLLTLAALLYLHKLRTVEIVAPDYLEPKPKKAPNHDIVQPAEVETSSAEKLFLQKAISMVEENMADPDFNVQQLCDKMFISRPQLYRKINAITGITITDFIKEIRLKRAAQLILQKPGNIAEISYQVGFNDPKYFSKCFKQQFGVPPASYKRPDERFLPLE